MPAGGAYRESRDDGDGAGLAVGQVQPRAVPGEDLLQEEAQHAAAQREVAALSDDLERFDRLEDFIGDDDEVGMSDEEMPL